MTMTMTKGEVSILNVATGDTKISFDPSKPDDVERAKAIVMDMLRRGYVLAVNVEGTMMRARSFDATKCEYIVMDDAPVPDGEEVVKDETKPRTKKERRVKAECTSVVAVGRTAGGALGYRAFGFPIKELRGARK